MSQHLIAAYLTCGQPSPLVNRIGDVEAGNEGRDGRPRAGNISTVYETRGESKLECDYIGHIPQGTSNNDAPSVSYHSMGLREVQK